MRISPFDRLGIVLGDGCQHLRRRITLECTGARGEFVEDHPQCKLVRGVSVELIDTATEQTLWSEQYDRTLDDVLSVQSDLALRIASALNATLAPEERTRVARPPTTNPAAYDLFLRSQELAIVDRQQNLRAIELLAESRCAGFTAIRAGHRSRGRNF